MHWRWKSNACTLLIVYLKKSHCKSDLVWKLLSLTPGRYSFVCGWDKSGNIILNIQAFSWKVRVLGLSSVLSCVYWQWQGTKRSPLADPWSHHQFRLASAAPAGLDLARETLPPLLMTLLSSCPAASHVLHWVRDLIFCFRLKYGQSRGKCRGCK